MASALLTSVLLIVTFTPYTDCERISTYEDISSRDILLLNTQSNTSRTKICNNFVHLANSMVIGGESIKKMSDGYSPNSCRQACIRTREFVCTGALIQYPAICYITGYTLIDSYYTVHFTRTCKNAGDGCYTKKRFKSGRFTKTVDVPWFIGLTDRLAEEYCMMVCDANEECIGFDMTIIQGKPIKCAYLDQYHITADSFDFYTRRC